MIMRGLAASCVLTLTLTPSPTGAQTPGPASALSDPHWAPFLGCWRAEGDRSGTGARLCVTPSGEGVTVTTVIANQQVSQETRVATGLERPVREQACDGTETAHWAPRSVRLYRSATVRCDAGPVRQLDSVSFLLDDDTWVDVEAVTEGAAVNVRASRLVRATNQRLPDGTSAAPAIAAPAVAAVRWTVEDVIELAHELPTDAVQAAISEGPANFRLNARTLTAMADAGVGERVIDLMVGLTYPSRFVVQRAAAAPVTAFGSGAFGWDPFFAPLVGPAALYQCYAPYGWASSAYWSNCAGYNRSMFVAYPGYYAGYWDPYGPAWVLTQAGGGGGTPVPQAEGRVVNGRGYTQVRPVEALPLAGGGSSSGGTSSGASSGSSGSGSNSNGVSSGGYSGGGSAGGGDRVAVPRPPPGGGR
ncbi:MAG: hypothetical protein R2745_05800 [Vicinamibacterales bacterium]